MSRPRASRNHGGGRVQKKPHLHAGKTLMFAHGFNVRFGTLDIPKDIDVSMIAPKSPGHRVRELYQEAAGTPALLAVHQDASGQAKQVALWKTPLSDCGDSRGTTCVDYATWTEKWLEVTGGA